MFCRLFAVFCAMVMCSVTSAQVKGDSEPVVLQLKWSHQFQFAGYYMAKELGFYENEGIDLEIRSGSSSLNVTEEVLSGRADFGVGTSSLLLDYAAGKPVVVLGVIYQHSPLVLIMRTEKSSDTIERVAAGPLMIEPNSGDLIAMLRRAGLSIDRLDITGHAPNALGLLESADEAFSISAYQTDEPYTLLRKNIPFNTFSPQTYGIDFYGDNFFTTQDTLKDRGDLVRGFRKATLLGWKEAIRDPEKAISLILSKYPATADREKLQYEARITMDLMTNLVEPGHMNLERWKHISRTFQEVGMLDESPDLDEFFFMEKKLKIPAWFWRTLLGVCLLSLFLALLSVHFKRLNARLGQEMKLRLEIEEDLKKSNKELTIAKAISEEANLKKTWFITNVSHDLRAPVSSMISLAQIFDHHGKSLNLPDKFNRFLKQLNSGGEFLMLLLDNILDHSAFEMNATSVCTERVDLAKCFDNIANLVQPLADEKDITIRVQWKGGQDDAMLDRTRLSQIVLNLLHNAIKFSPKSEVVSMDLNLEDDALHISIGDGGPGIPAERQKDLFQMFGESEKTGARHSSTGLGLSIVKRNVDLLGGTIRAERGRPNGTVFQVVLPVVKVSSTSG